MSLVARDPNFCIGLDVDKLKMGGQLVYSNSLCGPIHADELIMTKLHPAMFDTGTCDERHW